MSRKKPGRPLIPLNSLYMTLVYVDVTYKSYNIEYCAMPAANYPGYCFFDVTVVSSDGYRMELFHSEPIYEDIGQAGKAMLEWRETYIKEHS